MLLFKLFYGGLADHSPVSHDAESACAEAFLKSGDNWDGAGNVRRVARPHLAGKRSAAIIQQGANHHLIQIGAMILGMTQFTDGLAPFALEINRGSVEKHQVKIGE